MTAAGIAIGVAIWAAAVGVFALMRPVEGRQALTMQLSLSLLRYDEGLGLLAAQCDRDAQWWEDVDHAERHLIDRALSMWDLAAWYVASGRVDGRTVIEV